MKILYTCTYSAGISGVWNRVYNLAKEMLKKGHKVYVFSSNFEAGTLKQAKEHEKIDGIEIYRFKAKKFGSTNAFIYDAEKLRQKLNEIMPDVVDCQTYRHAEGNIISKECIKLKIPCFLTTHAPFVPLKLRGIKLSLFTFFYDFFLGRNILKRFRRIIAIAKWEYPYLKELGIKKNIEYIPNGIPQEFFKFKQGKESDIILFFGRVAPIKDLETLIRAMKLLENEKIKLQIVGPAEKEYEKALYSLMKELDMKNVEFKPAVYDVNKKIKAIDSCKIFVLPSKREALPQSLLEAMSRGKIVISSKTQGGLELIKEGKNGFLFDIGNEKWLADKIRYCIRNYKKLKNVQKNAKKFAFAFSWKIMSSKLEKLYKRFILV